MNLHIKASRPKRKRQAKLPLLVPIDPVATAELFAKHKLTPTTSSYLTFRRHSNIIGALAVDRLGFKGARAIIKDWDNTQHSEESPKSFAEALGLPEPYLAGLDYGFENGDATVWCKETVRHLGLVGGVAVRRLVLPSDQD